MGLGMFDATNIAPKQTGAKHPPGNKFPFTITKAEIADTKDNQGKMYVVTLTSPAGSIDNRYNLWNASKQAVEIAAGQLAALCHATGIFKVNMDNGGKEMIGGKGLMDIGFQSGQEPNAERPEGGYVEVKKIYDVNGNEPGVQIQQQQKQQTNSPPNNAANGGQNWSAGAAQQNNPAQGNNSWQGNVNNAAPQNTNQPNNIGGWQQGGADNTAPWNK